MAREKEMQEFTRSFFRGRPDLSTLTHSIVRRRYLAHSGRDHLEPEEKQALKRLVEEELLKMQFALLAHTQVDEAASREEKLDLTKKGKRPPTPCSDPERKRFRFNSESESGSEASSPDYFGPPAKNGVAVEVSPAKEENPRRASKKAVEESSDEERQRDLPAQRGEESSEEEEKGDKGKTRKKPVAKKQAPGKASVSRKQTREESEENEEEPVQRTAKKVEGNKGTKSLKESEQLSEEEEEILAGKKEHREEEAREEEKEGEEEKEDWKPRARSNGRRKSAREERSCKLKSQAKRLMGDSDSKEEQKEAAGSGDDSGRDGEPPVQKSKDRTQLKDGKGLSGSSEDEEDSGKGEPTAKGSRKTATLGSTSGEESDLEREVSDIEAGGDPQGERKNRSSKKSSRKGTTRSSSSSSDGSPEAKGGKAGSGRRGEDHPAVMRLKRYIRACGAHRNYKKLLGSCCSHKERLSILRAELEALGMKGTPSLEKCRALKEQREEAAEVASLDVANIISGSGRPRRRTAWNPLGEAAPPGELYRRTLDSDEERPRPAPPDWSHMRGIISSDGESN
ncbi:PREDICTED: HIRA-interacting protein 3 isoform X1 [Rhinopithecus bieti]|uniref:HIRA-interacting protein 3 isoform X1 n=1 Tax=Rhinopithecus bieti TaxID=61621 RepID=UPI00083C5FDC|nr:PREDICTED: HIRA-interacting protein 3 isoform X1 [Rhinopithecus bieti]